MIEKVLLRHGQSAWNAEKIGLLASAIPFMARATKVCLKGSALYRVL